MALSPGTRVGPYEVLSPLGAGGMGEVWKARDPKLDRLVAIKVLPASLAGDADALARFEREARAVAALSHPNILAIHDFGRDGETSYAVMELLEGETLRQRVARGAFSPTRAAEVAAQIARGLAAAHAKGIVHRDLKPENLFLTKDGAVKILDFGLARSFRTLSNAEETSVPTSAPGTEPGTVLGTVGYMSPEQVRGEPADGRSDLFSLGCVLYEMLSGRRPYQRPTAAETMTAILREEPPDLAAGGPAIPPALEGVAGSSSGISGPRSAAQAPRFRPSAAGIVLALLAVAGAVGLVSYRAGLRQGAGSRPTFRSLTRERGTLGAARFVPGTPDVAYSARWGLGSPQLWVTRADRPAPRLLPGFEGLLHSVSPSGEVLGTTDTFISHAISVGQLVSLPLSGGAARPWTDRVWSASWGERGEAVVVIGTYAEEFRLEWPLGHVVTKTRDVLRAVRVRGEQVAYFREKGDTFEDGILVVAGRDGSTRELRAVNGFTGLAWSPDGKELWVSTAQGGQSRIEAVDLGGGTRTLLTHAGLLEIQDVDPQGRVLAVVHSYQRQVYGRPRGGARDEDIGWLDAQAATGISSDGSKVLLAHLGQWNRAEGHIYLRSPAGGPPLDVGSGDRQPTLTDDGKWVVTAANDPVFGLRILPTGAGAPRHVPIPDFTGNDVSAFLLPGERTALVAGSRRDGVRSLFSIDLESGAVRRIAPEGASHFLAQTILSPDGGRIAFISPSPGGPVTSRVDGSDVRPVPALSRGEAISGWHRDSGSLVVYSRTLLPAPVDALDLASGKRTPLLKLMPADPVGISGVQGVMLSQDGGAYAYNVVRQLSELYLVEGLK